MVLGRSGAAGLLASAAAPGGSKCRFAARFADPPSSCRLKGFEIGDGFGGLRGSMEERALVSLEQCQPAGEILGMIGRRLVGDMQLGAEEGRAQIGDEFLETVGVVAEMLAEFAVQAMAGAGPVADFVEFGGVKAFRTRHCLRADEESFFRHDYFIGRRSIVSAFAGEGDAGAGRGDEAVSG